MFEVPHEFQKFMEGLSVFHPHNLLSNLLFGSAPPSTLKTSFFDAATAYEHMNPELPVNRMKNVRFTTLDIKHDYTESYGWYKGEFWIYNDSSDFKRITMEVYERFARVTKFSDGKPVASWTDETPLVMPARVIDIGPGGSRKVEFEYQVPPLPVSMTSPNIEDIMRIRVEVHMLDEKGNMAVLRDVQYAKV